MQRATPLIAGALVVYLPCAHGGVFYQMSARDLAAVDAKPVLTRGFAQDGRLREEAGDGSGSVVITAARALLTIDVPARSYQLLDKETLTHIGARERASHERIIAQEARLPADVRATLERVDEDTQRALAMEKLPLDYRATGRHEVVAGFSCSVWEYYWQGSKEAEYCIAAPASIPGGAEWLAALRAEGEFYANGCRWLGDPARLLFASTLARAEAPSRLDGIPLLSRTFRRGKAVSETRMTTEGVQPLNPNLFVVPNGYERQPAEPARLGR